MRTPTVAPEQRTWRLGDRYELRGRVWPGSRRSADAAIVYLHGIQSHGGWFEWSASLLVERGRPVVLPDRRGSGLNQAARGDTPRFTRWLDDLDDLAGAIQAEFGPQPLAVVGVSWGGKLAAAWALRRPEYVARLLLIAPGLFPAVDVGLLARIRIGLSLLRQPHRQFPIPLSDAALFTENPAGQAFIAGDPLKLTTATARFFYESTRLDHVLTRARAGALRSDTTLLLAERERIIRNQPTLQWLKRVCGRPPHVCEFTGAAHTLEFEADPEPFAAALRAWAAD